MNTDDFEKQLARASLRDVPQRWRGEILNAAQNSVAGIAPAARASNPGLGLRWRELLWPCPQAWAGVAAAWLLIFGLHLVAGAEPPRAAVQITAISVSPEWRALLSEQRRLFTELLPLPETMPARRPDKPANRSRSERRWQPEMPMSQVLGARVPYSPS